MITKTLKMKSTFKIIFSLLFLIVNSIYSQENIIVSEDAFVRGGTYENTNYGSAATLNIKKPSSNLNYFRYGFLKFDVSDFTNVNSAKLYIYAKAKLLWMSM